MQSLQKRNNAFDIEQHHRNKKCGSDFNLALKTFLNICSKLIIPITSFIIAQPVQNCYSFESIFSSVFKSSLKPFSSLILSLYQFALHVTCNISLINAVQGHCSQTTTSSGEKCTLHMIREAAAHCYYH